MALKQNPSCSSLRTHLGGEVAPNDPVAIFSRKTKTWQQGIAVRITEEKSVEVQYAIEDDNRNIISKKIVSPLWDGLVCKPSPGRLQLLRLRALINKPVLICFLGSTTITDPRTERIVGSIAEALSSSSNEHFAHITGGMPGVQEAIAEGINDCCRKQLFHIVPKGTRCPFEHGTVLHAGSDMEESRISLTAIADVYITIGGDKRVAEEAMAAHTRGAVVLPIRSTGGASSGMYNFPEECLEVPVFADQKPSIFSVDVSPEGLWASMSNVNKDPSDVGLAVLYLMMQFLEYKKQFSIFGGNLDCIPGSGTADSPGATFEMDFRA